MSAKHTIPAVDKTLKLLLCLAESAEPLSSAQLAKKLSIAPSTCYRIIQTLVAQDWLRATTSGTFTFSSGVFPMLRPLTDYQRLFEALGPPLRALVEATGLSAKISVKQGTQSATVYRVESPRAVSPSYKVGAQFPLAYGSSGACLLAGLPDDAIGELLSGSPGAVWQHQSEADVWARIAAVRAGGACRDRGQYHPTVHGLSAPVHNRGQAYFAAVSLVGWADDFANGRETNLAGRILATAETCTTILGYEAVA